MAKMTLFNFDSTSAVLKFETFKIAVFVNDLDFMFPPAEFKRFVLFKFEDSAEETIVYYSMQANSPLRGLKKSVVVATNVPHSWRSPHLEGCHLGPSCGESKFPLQDYAWAPILILS